MAPQVKVFNPKYCPSSLMVINQENIDKYRNHTCVSFLAKTIFALLLERNDTYIIQTEAPLQSGCRLAVDFLITTIDKKQYACEANGECHFYGYYKMTKFEWVNYIRNFCIKQQVLLECKIPCLNINVLIDSYGRFQNNVKRNARLALLNDEEKLKKMLNTAVPNTLLRKKHHYNVSLIYVTPDMPVLTDDNELDNYLQNMIKYSSITIR
jgi:hypothetical protein